MTNQFLFQGQYNQTYTTRLSCVRPLINLSTLNDAKIVKSLSEAANVEGYVAFVAILYIDALNKETIFDEYFFGKKERTIKEYENFTYYVEDESCRVEVIFEADGLFVTGQALGFLAYKDSLTLTIKDVIYPEELKPENRVANNNICFISDLKIGNGVGELQITMDYIKKNKEISDLVIMGDLFREFTDENVNWLIQFIKILDVNTFIIPNTNDPTNILLPQKPIHKRLINASCQFLSNPAQFTAGRNMLFVPPVSVQDIKLYKQEKSINILKMLLKTRQICPTAPDTIGCIPYKEIDPFVLESAPEYVFTIDDDFESEKDKVNFFVIPSFSKSKKAVVLNMSKNTLECISLEH